MMGLLLKSLLLFALSLLVFVAANTGNELPTDLKDLKELDIEKLKEHLPEGFIPAEFANMTLPSMEDIQRIVKDKCSKVAGSDAAFEQAEQASQRFGDCMKDLVDFSDIQNEIQKAKPTGDLDTVFNKYCRRRSAAIECINTYSNDIDVCLDDDEKDSKRIMVNIVHGLLNFVCHKDGDQIALFIAEEGPECFQEQKQPLIDCFNTTLRGYLDETGGDQPPQGIPKLVMGKRQCDDMDNLKNCFVRVLEDCRESTPANLVESLFKFVRKETPCANFTTPTTSRKNSGDTGRASINIILTTWMFALVAKFLIQ
ncbi:27 kDa glycoprotein-like [Uranotaenia lowii]|uniref:27 kDa glycoprotein-like n=1 Tax=Uranotaenia lowii TaxID=190385 RepID=UPI0024791ED2|nr:27 kDa glycoprotein-like [Uranotaenia lowii]XP_055606560.1 27 kDa glycoprotein-like [Uranotaenia lowii]XP_055606561.1 27 kDa glycoprotein-like [Uranotaenia lowii]